MLWMLMARHSRYRVSIWLPVDTRSSAHAVRGRHVVVPNPDVAGRSQILEVHFKNVPRAADVDLQARLLRVSCLKQRHTGLQPLLLARARCSLQQHMLDQYFMRAWPWCSSSASHPCCHRYGQSVNVAAQSRIASRVFSHYET